MISYTESLVYLFWGRESREQEHHDKAVTREPHRGKLHAPTEKNRTVRILSSTTYSQIYRSLNGGSYSQGLIKKNLFDFTLNPTYGFNF
jgi:hypothetical protein